MHNELSAALEKSRPAPSPELQAKALRLILDLVNQNILTIDSRDGMSVNIDVMKAYFTQKQGRKPRFEGEGFKLLLACPSKLQSALADQMPDGSRDWNTNREFIDWLRTRPDFQWLSQFPLAGRDPKSVV